MINIWARLGDILSEPSSVDVTNLTGFTMSKTLTKDIALTHLKLAACADRVRALKAELATLDFDSLAKQAAAGKGFESRVKAAALVRQLEFEKKAIAGGLSKLLFGELKRPGLVQKGFSGLANVLGQGARGIGGFGRAVAKGVAPNVGKAITDTGSAVGKFAKKNPREAMIGGTGLGLLAGANAKSIGQGISDSAGSIADSASDAGTGIVDYGKGLTQIPGDIAGGFSSAIGRLLGRNSSSPSPSSASNDYRRRFTNYRLRPNRF